MSSLAAARADGFYFPPEYDPSKGSLNKVRGCTKCYQQRGKLAVAAPACSYLLRHQMRTYVDDPECMTVQFNGQHPLRERAKKLGEGILIIRFEMPFNVWCGKCNHLIGKGVRFNAEKKVR